MKVILIFPPYNLFTQAYGSKNTIKQGNLPPLGLGYIAAILEKEGYEVKILDASAACIGFEQTVGIIKQFNPDLIGIYANNAVHKNSIALSQKIKETMSTPIVLGGPYPTCLPDECMKIKSVDYIVIGEGERSFPKMISAILNKKPLGKIGGIGYKQKGKVKFTESEKPIMNLDDLPRIAWHLYDMKLYVPLPNQYKVMPAINFITSRGCTWGKCAFCYQAGIMGQTYRRHSPERVIEDIKYLQKNYGIKEISFWDDNFLVNRRWINRFCDLLDQNKMNLVWSAYGRADTATKEILDRVAKSGCWSVFYGIESGNQDLLDRIEKGITIEQIKNTVKWTHKAGMETRGSFVIALPGETPEKTDKTIQFAIDLDLDYAQFAPAYPEYGTKLYDLSLKTGTILPYRGKAKATYIPEGYKSGEHVEYYLKKAYRRFYLRPGYVWKVLKKIRSFKDVVKYYEGFKFMLGLTN